MKTSFQQARFTRCQPDRTCHLIDSNWENWESVDSIVKINQSEGISAPAIPEEGH